MGQRIALVSLVVPDYDEAIDYTDDFDRDHARYLARGVEFVRPPKHEPYGQVAVFRDPWGNLWDLLEPA